MRCMLKPLSAPPAGGETAGDSRRAQAGAGAGRGNRHPRRSF
jgi:hypothetical protein